MIGEEVSSGCIRMLNEDVADLYRRVPIGSRVLVVPLSRITLARELTKQFEQIHTLPAREAAAWLAADPQHARGEFVVVIHPALAQASSGDVKRKLRQLASPEAGPVVVVLVVLPGLDCVLSAFKVC